MHLLNNLIMADAIPKFNTEGDAMLNLDNTTRLTLWVGLAIYIVIMLAIGCLAGRKVKNIGDFIVAGRRLPLWMATATLLATWFGAGSSMGVASTVYSGCLRDVIADPFGASLRHPL